MNDESTAEAVEKDSTGVARVASENMMPAGPGHGASDRRRFRRQGRRGGAAVAGVAYDIGPLHEPGLREPAGLPGRRISGAPGEPGRDRRGIASPVR